MRKLRQLLLVAVAVVGLGLFIYGDVTGAHALRTAGIAVVLLTLAAVVWHASSWR